MHKSYLKSEITGALEQNFTWILSESYCVSQALQIFGKDNKPFCDGGGIWTPSSYPYPQFDRVVEKSN